MSNSNVKLLSTVETFALGDEKDRACKVLEEAAELFGAWQAYEKRDGPMADVLSGAAGVIQAVCNMVAGTRGLPDDLTYAMKMCVKRNKDKGAYDGR